MLAKKISRLHALLPEMHALVDRVKIIFKHAESYTDLIDTTLEHLESLLNKIKLDTATPATIIKSYDACMMANDLMDIAEEQFDRMLDSKINVETFLSQTFVDETREYLAKVRILFKKARVDIAATDEEILTELAAAVVSACDDSYECLAEFAAKCTGPRTTALFVRVATDLGENMPRAILEGYKDAMLGAPKMHKYTGNNPFIKSYGLVPISHHTSHDDAAKSAFSIKGGTKKGIIAACKENGCDLLIIKSIINRGIRYNVLPLLSKRESAEFEQTQAADDGITTALVERLRTIDYISTKSRGRKFEYQFEATGRSAQGEIGRVLVLQQLHDEYFMIMSNNGTPLVHRDSIAGLIALAKTKKYSSTRAANYNAALNARIMEKAYLPVKPNLEKLKEHAQVVDPKYLRNEIYIRAIAQYKELHNKKPPKSLYDFGGLMRSEKFEQIFNRTIMHEYHKYTLSIDGIPLNEILSSFLYTMSIYSRDFRKGVNDQFITNLPARTLFESSRDEIDAELERVVSKIFDAVLSKIITNEGNMFQTVLYKVYLLRLSLLD